MKAIWKAAPLAVLGLGLFAALAITALALSAGVQTAHAQDPDGVIVGIDMDPTGNTCPQSQPGVGADCTLGAIDSCVSVSVGDPVTFDVFLDDLDLDSHLGHAYDLGGWPASGTDGVAPQMTNEIHQGADPAMSTSRAGAIIIEFSEGVPDGDDPQTVAVGDIGTAEYNPPYTQGVLGRYTLDTTGATPGVYGLTLSNIAIGRDTAVDAAYPDYPLGGDLPIQAVWDYNFAPQYGILAVGVPCPAFADVKILNQSLVTPPTEMNINTPTQVTLRKTLHNNGPEGPVDVTVTTTVTPPADCTATPGAQVPPNPVSLPVSVDVQVDETWTIECTQPSTHAFTFENSITIVTPDVIDSNPANNTASTPLSVNALAETDVTIASQAFVSPPAEIMVGVGADVTLRKTLHNNGTYGPVAVSITTTATPPPPPAPVCTVIADPTNPTSANLPVSVDVVADEVWTINCAAAATAVDFVFDNAIAITTQHVSEPVPDPTPNTASTTLTVDVTLRLGDVDCSGGPLDITDAVLILQNIVGLAPLSMQCPPPPGELFGPAADAYGDGVDIADAVLVLQCIVGRNNIMCPAE